MKFNVTVAIPPLLGICSNMNKERRLECDIFSFLLVSIVGFLEHFNINVTCAYGAGAASCWMQDVQNRVFTWVSNWLATYWLHPCLSGWILKSKKLFTLKSFAFLQFCFYQIPFPPFGFFFHRFNFWGYVLFKFKKISYSRHNS